MISRLPEKLRLIDRMIEEHGHRETSKYLRRRQRWPTGMLYWCQSLAREERVPGSTCQFLGQREHRIAPDAGAVRQAGRVGQQLHYESRGCDERCLVGVTADEAENVLGVCPHRLNR